MFKEWFAEYGFGVMASVVTALFSFFGLCIKNYIKKLNDNKVKKEDAETVVKAVEQMYSELSGSEKLIEATKALSEMLENKGIQVTDLEIRMLIEAAVAGFNKPWKKEAASG